MERRMRRRRGIQQGGPMKRISTTLACLSLLFAALALAAPVPAPAPAPAAPAAPIGLATAPATAPAVLATPAQPPAPLWLDGKCATCPELLKACKTFCGSNNVTFNCQNHNPCAGTCTCTI